MPVVPVLITGAVSFRPLVDPSNTVVVASQTRLDGPQTDLCRRPCRVVSSRFAFNTPQKPSRDPRRDVDFIVLDAIMSLPRVVVPVVKSRNAGHKFKNL